MPDFASLKTINIDQLTLKHSTTNTTGDLLVNNATQYVRQAKGAILTYLRVNAAGTALEYANPDSRVNVLSVETDGSGDYTTIEGAITFVNGRPTTEYYIIQIGAGDFVTTTGGSLTRGNVWLKGSGQGITRWIGSSSLADTTPIFQVRPTNSGSGDTLESNATLGATTITLTTHANAANYVDGDFILIKSLKQIDDEITPRYQGELHRVVGTGNSSTGVVTLDTTLYDTYTTANTARVVRLTNFYENIKISGISFSTQKTSVSNSLADGQGLEMRFIKNLEIDDCEFGKLFGRGMRLYQIMYGHVSNCYIHDIFDTTPTSNQFYGMEIRSADINILIDSNYFDNCRHGLTYGSDSGSNLEGQGRNIIVDGNTFRNSRDCHIDNHQGVADMMISNNAVISNNGLAYGIQCRSPTLVIGNTVKGIAGRGIYLFYTTAGGSLGGSSGSQVIGNWIADTQNAIFLEYNVNKVLIAGNYCRGSTSSGGAQISNQSSATAHSGDDCAVIGNFITDPNGATIGINWDSAVNTLISNNYIKGGTTGIAIANTDGTLANYCVMNNFITGNSGTAITGESLGTGHMIRDNYGFKTEASGTATITSAATTIAVTHGLGYTPSLNDISITNTNNPTNTLKPAWISSPTSTQFTINVNTAPGASTATFVWNVRRV